MLITFLISQELSITNLSTQTIKLSTSP